VAGDTGGDWGVPTTAAGPRSHWPAGAGGSRTGCLPSGSAGPSASTSRCSTAGSSASGLIWRIRFATATRSGKTRDFCLTCGQGRQYAGCCSAGAVSPGRNLLRRRAFGLQLGSRNNIKVIPSMWVNGEPRARPLRSASGTRFGPRGCTYRISSLPAGPRSVDPAGAHRRRPGFSSKDGGHPPIPCGPGAHLLIGHRPPRHARDLRLLLGHGPHSRQSHGAGHAFSCSARRRDDLMVNTLAISEVAKQVLERAGTGMINDALALATPTVTAPGGRAPWDSS
jgi:hypothetical protein